MRGEASKIIMANLRRESRRCGRTRTWRLVVISKDTTFKSIEADAAGVPRRKSTGATRTTSAIISWCALGIALTIALLRATPPALAAPGALTCTTGGVPGSSSATACRFDDDGYNRGTILPSTCADGQGLSAFPTSMSSDTRLTDSLVQTTSGAQYRYTSTWRGPFSFSVTPSSSATDSVVPVRRRGTVESLPALLSALLLLPKVVPVLAAPAALSRSGGAPQWRGLSTIIIAAVALGGPRPADAFTCPLGCSCGTSNSWCMTYAVSLSLGGAVDTCAECRGTSAIPVLTNDTSVLNLWHSPNLGPVIDAPGFQFPSSWTSLKAL